MKQHVTTLWRRARFYSAGGAVLVCHAKLAGVHVRTACAPGFACHGCPWASFTCPVGALTFGASIRALPYVAVGMVLLVGAGLGRLVCGWACPFGWFQDVLHRIPSPVLRLPRWTRYLKYVALALLVFGLPAILGTATAVAQDLYYCRVCPNGTLTAWLPSVLGEGGSGGPIYDSSAGRWIGVALLVVFLVLMVLTSRPFCRMFCPLGALYGILAPYAVSGLSLDRASCVECGACDRVCPVELDVRSELSGRECIACGDCATVCPANCIRRSFGFNRPGLVEGQTGPQGTTMATPGEA